MNVLYIDTSSNKEIKIGLQIDRKTYWLKRKISYQKAQDVLPLIDKLLTSKKINLSEITGIYLVTGPGSFTGLRIGAVVASTFGWLLDIPINGKRQIVYPEYMS